MPRIAGAGLAAVVSAPALLDGTSTLLLALLTIGLCAWGLLVLARVPVEHRSCRDQGGRFGRARMQEGSGRRAREARGDRRSADAMAARRFTALRPAGLSCGVAP
ncbi:hypothetical protein [Streptomyces sp. NPDC057287]|uniref:hypothetical protein n=1 Tax=Streptomyces sp. NPDC057287 TaxID=3346086 RepID=UPI00363E2C9B